MTRLARALRLYIAATGIEQKELAELWECSEATVSRFLAGGSLPEATTIVAILAWSLGNEQ